MARCRSVILLSIVIAVLLVTPLGAATPSLTRTVAAIVGDVSGAEGSVYSASATNGTPLDALKIIQGPEAGNYLGVFHKPEEDDRFAVQVALSTNLSSWTVGATLSQNASMPTIAAVGDGYLVAFELADRDGKSQIEVEYFAGYQQLLAAAPARVVRLSRHLSSTNEGTPSFRSVTVKAGLNESRIIIGFHYNTGNDLDRNGTGTLVDFTRWGEQPNSSLNHALEAQGVQGSIGARTAIKVHDVRVQVVEGQLTPNSWSAWRLYAYQPSTHQASPITISTSLGSHLSIGVPRASHVETTSGAVLLVLSAFVYRQGSPRRLSGELIWWNAYPEPVLS